MRDGETKQIEFSNPNPVSVIRGKRVVGRVTLRNFFIIKQFQSDIAEFYPRQIDLVGDVFKGGFVEFRGFQQVGQVAFGVPEMVQRTV